MQPNIGHTESHESTKNEVRDVTIILSVITLIELALGYWIYAAELSGFLATVIKGTILILMMAKAFYIVAYFMHLKHELKNMIMTIVVPLFIFVWFIIAFLYDGGSFRELRNTYDKYHHERSLQPATNAEGHGPDKEHTKELPQPAH